VKTIDENEGKQGKRGRRSTKSKLEPYDVEDAIAKVQHLAKGLIKATKHAKHRFREEWVEQLIARYRAFPGKPIIHLDDLYDDVIPTLSCERFRPMLVPYWKRLVAERGYDWCFTHFRGIRDVAVDARKVSRWSNLRSWRKFSALTALPINTLEPYVVALRVSKSGTSRVITNPRLPFNLATPAGAKTIGYLSLIHI